MRRAAALFPFVLLLAAALYLNSHWNELPERFPIHWSIDGKANGWANRSVLGVYGPLILGGALAGILIVVGAAGRQVLDLMLVAACEMGLVFSAASLIPAFGATLFVVTTAVTVPVAIVASIRCARRMQTPPPDDNHWVAGLIYFNRDNPALLVPKRIGIGWTLNMARPAAWVFLTALIALPFIAIRIIR